MVLRLSDGPFLHLILSKHERCDTSLYRSTIPFALQLQSLEQACNIDSANYSDQSPPNARILFVVQNYLLAHLQVSFISNIHYFGGNICNCYNNKNSS